MFTRQQIYLLAMNNSSRRIKYPKNKSIVPRTKCDSRTYLSIYQVVVRREHLNREMKKIEERLDQIKEEIAFLDQTIKDEKMKLEDEKAEEINEKKKSKSSDKPIINELTNQTSIPVKSKFKTINVGY